MPEDMRPVGPEPGLVQRGVAALLQDAGDLRAEGFRRIAGRITKIRFLGTAIHSYWRYRTHWCDEPGGGVDCEEAREWFQIAFDRMRELLNKKNRR